MKEKKRIEIFVSENVKTKLTEIAEDLGIGVATVIKLAIDKYLKPKEK